MNKYQEALDNYSENVDYRDYSTKTVDIVNESYDTLQELVDKETPNVFVDKFGVAKCGNCKEPITHPKFGIAKYCLHCGQKMWSDE